MIIDLTGKTYGILKVVKLKGRKHRGTVWECLCECGKIKDIKSNSLRRGATKSCGCRQGNGAKHPRLPGNEPVFRHGYRAYKGSAELRNLEFEITYEMFKDLVSKNCYYCDSPPRSVSYQRTRSKPSTGTLNGIDRIDSTKGYILSNIRTCCTNCNYAKRQMSEIEFVEWIAKVFNNLKSKGINNAN